MNASFVARYAAHHDLSPAAAEAAISEALQDAAQTISLKRIFTFGCHQREDIAQQIIVEGLLLLDRDEGKTYDPARKLLPYLLTALTRRMHNFKRNNFYRCTPPCRCCGDPFNPPANPCERWLKWYSTNTRKCALAAGSPLDPTCLPEPGAVVLPEYAELVAEIDDYVDRAFHPSLRQDYLRMKAGVAVTASRRKAIQRAIINKFGESEDAL